MSMTLGITWIHCCNQGIKWGILKSGIIISTFFLDTYIILFHKLCDAQALIWQAGITRINLDISQDSKDFRIALTKIQSCGPLTVARGDHLQYGRWDHLW